MIDVGHTFNQLKLYMLAGESDSINSTDAMGTYASKSSINPHLARKALLDPEEEIYREAAQ
jgi:hypothetical protein